MMNDNFIIPKWPAPKNIKAIQTTRNGGISLEKFSSLNFKLVMWVILKHMLKIIKKIIRFLYHQIHFG